MLTECTERNTCLGHFSCFNVGQQSHAPEYIIWMNMMRHTKCQNWTAGCPSGSELAVS